MFNSRKLSVWVQWKKKRKTKKSTEKTSMSENIALVLFVNYNNKKIK